jgi:hypothetical protein
MLVSWTHADAASRWTPAPTSPTGAVRHRVVRIVRDETSLPRGAAGEASSPS